MLDKVEGVEGTQCDTHLGVSGCEIPVPAAFYVRPSLRLAAQGSNCLCFVQVKELGKIVSGQRCVWMNV